jgi:hypothetical protein
MPRPRKDDVFGGVRRQASKVLALLGQEIQKREAELQHLMRQAESWRAAIGGGPTLRATRGGRVGAPARAAAGGGRRGGARVNWSEVLASTPQTFGVSDVLKHPGARAKGRAQIYAALSRWLADKKVRRIAMGRYEKTGASAGSTSRAARKPRRAGVKRAKRGNPVKRAARRPRSARPRRARS